MTAFERKRKAAGLSQEALAEKVGVDRVSVSRWDNNQCEPRAEFIPKIAEALGVTGEEVTHLFAPQPATAG